MNIRADDRPLLGRHTPLLIAALTLWLGTGMGLPAAAATRPAQAKAAQDAKAAASAPGVPFSAEAITSMLPVTVWFQGKVAPVQARNAGGTTFAGGAVMWVAMVDSSGYSSSIQERYQFYLVTETPLVVGDVRLAAGAYGGGFVGDRFLIMDLGGHSVAEGAVQHDPALARPRPLAVLPDSASSVKLYLGRRFVLLRAQ